MAKKNGNQGGGLLPGPSSRGPVRTLSPNSAKGPNDPEFGTRPYELLMIPKDHRNKEFQGQINFLAKKGYRCIGSCVTKGNRDYIPMDDPGQASDRLGTYDGTETRALEFVK